MDLTPLSIRCPWRSLLTVALFILLCAGIMGCEAAPPEVVPEPSPSPLLNATPAEAGLAVMGYLDNFLVRVERGDWTPDEGIEQSLRMLVGGAAQVDTLLRRPLASHDLTGLIATGRESVDGIAHPGRKGHVQRILDMLVFDSAQLEAMALNPLLPAPTLPPRATPTGPLPTTGSQDVESEPPPVLPTLDTDCQRFFRRFSVGNVERCLAAREGTVGQAAYSVYSPAPSLATFGWQELHHDLVDEALAEAMAVYGELGALPKVTVVLTVNLDVRGDAASVIDDNDCRIMIYTDAQRRSETQFKQIIAHQLGHCFQAATFPDQQEVSYAARRWREDGLAAYLSSLVYPDANVEVEAISPLVEMDRTTSMLDWSAATMPWWQFVANDRGWAGIESIVRALPDEGGIEEQASALARAPGVDVLFTGFAEAFIDGLISDGSGGMLPTTWLPTFQQEEAAIDEAGAIIEQPLAPFSLDRRLLVVPGNLRAQLDSTAGDDVAIRTRPLLGSDWGPLPEAFPTDCTSDVRLVLLTTSVAADSEDIRLSISEITPSGC